MEELFALRPGRYRHFKDNEYELLYVARHSETLEPMVVYRALYGERGVWVRPAAMWSEPVDRDGYHGPRFQWIGGVSEEVDGLQKYFSRFLKKGLLFAESCVIIHKLTSRSQPRIRV